MASFDPRLFAAINPVSSAPTSGSTVTAQATGPSTLLYINPAGTLTTLTLTLNSGNLPGQELKVVFGQGVTLLTVTSTNIISALPLGGITALGFSLEFVWDSSQAKWIRVL